MYISKTDQEDMKILLNTYYAESESGNDIIANRALDKLFNKYVNKIIAGVIFSSKFMIFSFEDPDDLKQIAALEVYKSIRKKQWNEDRGSIFNFFTTVIKKNLTWYTLGQNKKRRNIIKVDIEEINDELLEYNENYDGITLEEDIFMEMKMFFAGKERMERLAEVFIEYYHINRGKKFIKKHFIEYAATHTFSPSFCHTFFSNLKKIKSIAKTVEGFI